ncbi:MAG: hypothetical protein U0T73_12950 [Chitinophagales bacterium]
MTLKILCSWWLLLGFYAAQSQSCCAMATCGSSSILPAWNRQLAGVRYSFREFHIPYEKEGDYSGTKYTGRYQLHTTELFARFNLSGRHYLSASLPYSVLHSSVKAQLSSGIGDPVLLYQYQLVRPRRNSFQKWRNDLRLGAGLKFPLGKFDRSNDQAIQFGTGSLDFLFNAFYAGRAEHIGLLLSASYKANTFNADRVKLGNKFQAGASVFYEFRIGAVKILPVAGWYFEKVFFTKVQNKWKTYTGSQTFSADAGFDLAWKRIAFSCRFQPVIYNTVNHYTVPKSVFTFETGMYYTF